MALAASALPLPPASAATEDEPVLSLTLASATGVVAPGADLVVSGTVTNLGTAATGTGTVTVGLTAQDAERAEIQAGLSDPASVESRPVATLALPSLPAGASAPVALTVPAADVSAALSRADWGALLLTGRAELGGTPVAHSSSGFVWSDGDAPAPLRVVTIVPFTTPGDTEGLLDAETLNAYLSADGVLRAKLDAVRGTPAAIALDPRILASIRALGTDAPPSAVIWLADLRAAGNVIFPLSYADSDLSLQRAAGAPAVLSPGSFESSLDPDDFAAGAVAEATPPSTAPPAAPTPSPSPTEGAGTLPTAEDLLRWDYTFGDVAWPTTVRPGDLPFLTAAGYTRALVPSSSLADPPSPLPATATIEGSSALIVDSVLSDAVSEAAAATSEAAGRAAFGDATALLAATADEADTETTVIVGMDRGWPSSTASTAAALAALRALPWAAPAALDAVTGTGPDLAIRGDQPADPRVPAASLLIQDDAAIGQFASVLERPELLTGRERLRLLAVLSAQWLEFPQAWQTAANDLHARFDAILHSVTITQTSLLVLSPDIDVPVYVQNDLDFPVRIVLTGRPSNARLLVENAEAVIDPGTSQRVGLPARSIANGRVTLAVTASSPTGIPVGDTAFITVDVQAEWEAVGTAVVIGLVAALFGFGLWRSIRRRRRASRTAE